MMGLRGKRALVTGGCKGIGKAIVQGLEAEGCLVNSVCRCKGYDLNELAAVFTVKDYYGDCDILINNIGGGGTWPDNQWEGVLHKNIYPMMELTNYCVEYMKAQKWGRVVTVASIFGKESGGTPAFTMAKSAQIAYMKSLAIKQYEGVTFNSVCPGPILVDGKEMKYERYGLPEDVANLVVFLCSDKARWINGATITVDGGMSRSF